MSEVGGALAPLSFRPASSQRTTTVVTAFIVVIAVVGVVLGIVGRKPVLAALWGLQLLLHSARLAMLLLPVRVDGDGVRQLGRTLPWSRVNGVRVSRWNGTVVLELDKGKERQLALPASDGERVAELAGVPLINPPRL
ncbi:hypothetical protein [Lapillicoccus jejuensis]|uniref:PH (Pleckstrin Homology) domain-containing protein n=1 Tax=Lapillicoccus jejuensis TaxID=402171 RepID=A0A542DYR6_9MICO|nr:hypothetical protein [Lapillicoccus jejuensis]TQJ08235.1 hypothetical protein FB458_1319 [Lapillicoccus jejuensis]